MKKIAAFCLIAFGVSGAFARHQLEGFYTGMSVGDTYGTVAITDKVIFLLGGANTQKENLNGHAFDVSANFGWGIFVADNIYTGLEGRIGYVPKSETCMSEISFPGFGTYYSGTRIKNGLYLGIAGRLGYAVSENSMVYMRMGVDWQHYKLNFTDDSIHPLISKNSTRALIVVGAGFEWLLAENITSFFEAEHAFGSHKKFKEYNGIYVDIQNSIYKKEYGKTSMRVGLRYRF